jgi:hypothetical protein
VALEFGLNMCILLDLDEAARNLKIQMTISRKLRKLAPQKTPRVPPV